MKSQIPHILLVLALSTFTLGAQNLIKNPSFEAYTNCPSRLGNFHKDVKDWSCPTQGSTDYFNICSTSMGAPENFNGKQAVDFGKGYAGMYMYAPDDYREYIQVALNKPLKKGVSYELSFQISLAERSDFAVKEFGIVFSQRQIDLPIRKTLSKTQLHKLKGNKYHHMEIGYTNFYRDTHDWISVNTIFEAKGTERFMTIGNFKDNARTRKFTIKKGAKQGAYYYIDMIALRPSADNSGEELGGVEELELNKTHTFDALLFKFDKFDLLQSAKADLAKLYDYLKVNPGLSITIHGHTDSIGSNNYNKILSQKRCVAVVNYMKSIGLDENRIGWKAHGGSKPLEDNSTEAGREKNRRVEFVISEQPN